MSMGISNHLFPDGQRYSLIEKKSIAAKRALFGEDSPPSVRFKPLKQLEFPLFAARCPSPLPAARAQGPVAEPFWPSGDQAS